jgi:hypothetical protein
MFKKKLHRILRLLIDSEMPSYIVVSCDMELLQILLAPTYLRAPYLNSCMYNFIYLFGLLCEAFLCV